MIVKSKKGPYEMSKIQLILSDVDGTLLDPHHQITSNSKSIVKQLNEKGIELVLASARAPKAMDFLATELGLSSPMVCFNGSLIIQKKAGHFVDLYSLPLKAHDLAILYELISSQFAEISFNIYAKDQWLVDKKGYWERQEAKITTIMPRIIDFEDYIKGNKPVNKILCMGKENEIDRLQDRIQGLALPSISVNKSKSTYLEIVHKEVSKLRALQLLTEKRSLSMVNTLAIGDNYNDLPMIQHAGIGIAMGNAPQDVKQAADIIAPTNAENGFYYGLLDALAI